MAKKPAAAKGTKPTLSGETVKKATGRDWDEWCRALDGEKAQTMKHGEIARLVHDKFNGGDWWSQMVAVGYEQLRGLRVLHQKAGGFEVSKSKTVNAPLAKAYRAFFSPAARKKWLADPAIEIQHGKGKQIRALRVGGRQITR